MPDRVQARTEAAEKHLGGRVYVSPFYQNPNHLEQEACRARCGQHKMSEVEADISCCCYAWNVRNRHEHM